MYLRARTCPHSGPTRYLTESWVIRHCHQRSFNCLSSATINCETAQAIVRPGLHCPFCFSAEPGKGVTPPSGGRGCAHIPPAPVSVRHRLSKYRKEWSRDGSVSVQVPPRLLQTRREPPGVAEPSRACQHAGHMGRSKATFDIPADLLAELRVASAMSGETLAAMAERGLTAELQRLRRKIMGGKPFPMPVKTRKSRRPKA